MTQFTEVTTKFAPVPYAGGQPPSLVIFETVRRQIAEATTTDEVKSLLAMATGLAAAAHAATESEMEAEAKVLKLEAERKLGQLMAAQREMIGFNKGGGDQRSDHRDSKKPGGPPTLADAGIDKNLAQHARTAAAMSEAEFAAAKEATRQSVRTPRTRHTKPKKPQREIIDECVDKVRSLIDVTVKALKSTSALRADFERLFAALEDTLADLESTTLTPEDEGVDDAEVADAR
jgi:hypothetical protein